MGDYVADSESLRDAAQQGRAGFALASLFDRALVGWHRFVRMEETTLAVGLSNWFPKRNLSEQREAVAKDLGAALSRAELRALFSKCTSTPVAVGPVHGDLHVFNVRVRATDAVLLDFYAHRQHPVLWDFASLEASLLIDGFADDRRELATWYDSVRPLYNVPLFEGTRLHPNPKEPSCWFYDCVRQVRSRALHWEMSSGQYAATLAVALLNKSVKDPQVQGIDSDRRAAAWALGELVLQGAFGGSFDAVSAPASESRT